MNHGSEKVVRSWSLFIALLTVALLTVGDVPNAWSHGRNEREEKEIAPNPDTRDSVVAGPSREAALASVVAGYKQLEPIFRRSCYDCHSDYTVFPWYYKLPVIKGMIDADIRGAHKHINMTKGFPFIKGHGSPVKDLKAIKEELVAGDMPPKKYILMHLKAKPSGAERVAIFKWIDESIPLLQPFEKPDTLDWGDE